MTTAGKKLRNLAVVAAAAAALTLAPATAHAEDAPVGLVESPVAPNPVFNDPAAEARLNALVGSQSAEQIESLADVPGTTVLIDPDSGEFLSAVNDPRARALSWLSPGCGASGKDLSACVTSNGAGIGYIGKGKLSVNLKKTTAVAAGSYVTSATTSGGTISIIRPGVRGVYKTPVTITYLTRG